MVSRTERLAETGTSFALCGSDKLNELSDDCYYDRWRGSTLACQRILDLPLKFALLVPDRIQDQRKIGVVATSYPQAFRRFRCEEGNEELLGDSQQILMSGKAESCVATGEADAVFDIFETGETAEANSLKVLRESVSRVALCGLWKPTTLPTGFSTRNKPAFEQVEDYWLIRRDPIDDDESWSWDDGGGLGH